MTLSERIEAAQDAYRKAEHELALRDRELALLLDEARKVHDERMAEFERTAKPPRQIK
jgi:hypothetical protein